MELMYYHAHAFVDGAYLPRLAADINQDLPDPHRLMKAVSENGQVQGWAARTSNNINTILARTTYYDTRPDSEDSDKHLSEYWRAIELLPDTHLGSASTWDSKRLTSWRKYEFSPESTLFPRIVTQAFRTGCILSSTVMLGVTTEHTFLLLLETIDNNAVHASTFAGVQQERTTLRKINKFKNIVDQMRKSFPKELIEDFDTNFLAIQSLIRTFRNEAGHPTGKLIDREQAFINLQLFIPFGRKAYEWIAYFKGQP